MKEAVLAPLSPVAERIGCTSLTSNAPPDSYFVPCASCQLREGFDAVAELEKQRRPARVAAVEECEEFTLMLPTIREEET